MEDAADLVELPKLAVRDGVGAVEPVPLEESACVGRLISLLDNLALLEAGVGEPRHRSACVRAFLKLDRFSRFKVYLLFV